MTHWRNLRLESRFYCFSTDTYKLYKSFDNNTYIEIDEFGDFSKKRNWNIYERERLGFLKKEEVDFINSKLENDIIGCWISYTRPRKTPININDKEIFILEKELEKYFVIKGEIYNEKFEMVKEDKIISGIKYKNEDYSIFILDTFKYTENIKKKSNK